MFASSLVAANGPFGCKFCAMFRMINHGIVLKIYLGGRRREGTDLPVEEHLLPWRTEDWFSLVSVGILAFRVIAKVLTFKTRYADALVFEVANPKLAIFWWDVVLFRNAMKLASFQEKFVGSAQERRKAHVKVSSSSASRTRVVWEELRY